MKLFVSFVLVVFVYCAPFKSSPGLKATVERSHKDEQRFKKPVYQTFEKRDEKDRYQPTVFDRKRRHIEYTHDNDYEKDFNFQYVNCFCKLSDESCDGPEDNDEDYNNQMYPYGLTDNLKSNYEPTDEEIKHVVHRKKKSVNYEYEKNQHEIAVRKYLKSNYEPKYEGENLSFQKEIKVVQIDNNFKPDGFVTILSKKK